MLEEEQMETREFHYFSKIEDDADSRTFTSAVSTPHPMRGI
jgi:hypothetical protein